MGVGVRSAKGPRAETPLDGNAITFVFYMSVNTQSINLYHNTHIRVLLCAIIYCSAIKIGCHIRSMSMLK